MKLQVEFSGDDRGTVIINTEDTQWVATKARNGRWLIDQRFAIDGKRGFATLEDLLTAIETGRTHT